MLNARTRYGAVAFLPLIRNRLSGLASAGDALLCGL